MVSVFMAPDRDIVYNKDMTVEDALLVIDYLAKELERQKGHYQHERDMWRTIATRGRL